MDAIPPQAFSSRQGPCPYHNQLQAVVFNGPTTREELVLIMAITSPGGNGGGAGDAGGGGRGGRGDGGEKRSIFRLKAPN